MIQQEEILGYKVCVQGCNLLLDEIMAKISEATPNNCYYFSCLNPHSYYLASKDQVFADALKRSDWLIPDGAGIVMASKMGGGKIQGRITGYDMFVGLNSRINALGGSVFLLGSEQSTLEAIEKKITTEFPGIRVLGKYSPPFTKEFSDIETNEMLQRINEKSPDILWVGLSAPKQEKWLYDNLYKINARIAGPIGAVFDFYSGNIKRSSNIFRNNGLEWLPRLMQEPRRLWRRMFISAPMFCWHLLKNKRSKSSVD